MPDFDLVLHGGLVYDGSGAPPRREDVGLCGDRIAHVGPIDRSAGTPSVDVSGLAVAPGFIDVHTHDDRALLSSPSMSAKLSQGVTTVVTGNCGISLAPLLCDKVVPPLDLIATTEYLRFASFAQYLDELERLRPAVNVVSLVGHTTLRVGARIDLQKPATPDKCLVMRQQLEASLEAGAWGMSTGTFYPPARAATTEEIISVGEPLTRYGGLYATHMRNEAEHVLDALDETFEIGRALGVRVVISHHKLAGIANHGRSIETLARISRAMAEQPVSLDCYPYNASSTMLHPDLIDRASAVLITWSTAEPRFNGRELGDVARELGCDKRTAASRLMPAGAIYFVMDEADVRRILAFEPTMIGSDGLPHDDHPHPRLWGAFPRVLGHYSRDTGLFPLETAIHKMSGLTATQIGIERRGFVREGYFADLVVFDPATVADAATFEQPAKPARGIHFAFVNGRLSYSIARIGDISDPLLHAEAARTSGNRHGRVLRRPRRQA